jgi:hypothetical protein
MVKREAQVKGYRSQETKNRGIKMKRMMEGGKKI